MEKQNRSLGLVGKFAIGASAILGSLSESGNSYAGTFGIANYTPNPAIARTSIVLYNKPNALEGVDSFDGRFQDLGMDTLSLQIYTNIDGTKLRDDFRPINTSGWDFYLNLKGAAINLPNSLAYQVIDTTDLIGKELILTDLAYPDIHTELLMDGAGHFIDRPNLNRGPGEYAHYRVDVVNTPEPGTLALAGAGALAGLGAYLHKRRNRGKELRRENRRAKQ